MLGPEYEVQKSVDSFPKESMFGAQSIGNDLL